MSSGSPLAFLVVVAFVLSASTSAFAQSIPVYLNGSPSPIYQTDNDQTIIVTLKSEDAERFHCLMRRL
jgi:hypothetical protein